MMNRLRTALVSVTAVAVAMMVLGSNARAGSDSTASQQKYVSLLLRLAEREIKNGTSLMQRDSSLQRTMSRLETMSKAAAPTSRLVRKIDAKIATVYKQQLTVVASLQKNTNALLATQALLQVQYQALQQALPSQKDRKEALQVYKELNSIQRNVVAERAAATPSR